MTLVASSDAGDLVEAIRASTGARVTVLKRAEAMGGEPDAASIIAALESVEAEHVMVIAGAKSNVEVIPLAD